MSNLKEKLLSRLRRVKKGVDSLNNLNEELKPIIKPILNYNLMVPLKKVNDGIVVLATGNLDKKLTVKATRFTKAAAEKIESAGGKIEVI